MSVVASVQQIGAGTTILAADNFYSGLTLISAGVLQVGNGGTSGQIGGGGPITIGRMGRNFNVNQPHGFLYFQNDNSGLDARPYSLTGIQTNQADYSQSRFGANIGGPLNIPKIFNGGNKWFFFGGWNGSRGSTPYDYYSTVLEQR